jgi:hypothetical protein
MQKNIYSRSMIFNQFKKKIKIKQIYIIIKEEEITSSLNIFLLNEFNIILYITKCFNYKAYNILDFFYIIIAVHGF